MITAQDALSFQPQKAGMNGYRATEVDQFISEVAQTLDFYEKKIRDLQNKINELKQNETIIQATLVNAQKLAMQITDESKAEASQVTAEAATKAEALLGDAEQKASEIISDATARAQKLNSDTDAVVAKAEKEAAEKAARLISEAENTAANISAKAEIEIKHETEILNALRAEVAKFRSDILDMYKEQVRLICNLPDAAPAVEQKAEPELEAEAEAEPEVEVEIEIEAGIEVAEETEPVDSASGDLLKIMSDMDENERYAAESVDEVASMSEGPIEGQVSLLDFADADDEADEQEVEAVTVTESEPEDDIPVVPVTKREGGFVINFDDDDDDDNE